MLNFIAFGLVALQLVSAQSCPHYMRRVSVDITGPVSKSCVNMHGTMCSYKPTSEPTSVPEGCTLDIHFDIGLWNSQSIKCNTVDAANNAINIFTNQNGLQCS
jgi:hypothetical protein